MPTTITYSNATSIYDQTGLSPIAAATITSETVNVTGSSNVNGSFNVVNNLAFLRGGGFESVDYLIGANNSVTLLDQSVFFANGARAITYYGSEALNPFLATTPATPAIGNTPAVPGFSPPNPGYALTQYTYAPNGTFQQVLAVEANGKSFVGTSLGGIG